MVTCLHHARHQAQCLPQVSVFRERQIQNLSSAQRLHSEVTRQVYFRGVVSYLHRFGEFKLVIQDDQQLAAVRDVNRMVVQGKEMLARHLHEITAEGRQLQFEFARGIG
jgi:hypothetical protein